MKNSFLLLALFITTSVFAEVDVTANGVEEPEWKSFAPTAYVDVKQPKGLGKFNDVAAYWYKRRVDFENGIEKCRAVSGNDDQFSCYQALKVKQYQKNSDYNARLEAIERSQMGPQEMMDRTNTMYPLGGFTNMMKFQANEFN